MAVTIMDVAKRAGVAISTVSNILNGTKYVSPETTRKVLEAIDALGYVADPIARNMKSSRSKMIGIIVTNFTRVFFAPILRQCREIAATQGYQLMCIDSNDDFEQEKKYVSVMSRNRFDAIILDSVADQDDRGYFDRLCHLSKKGGRIAVVCIERDLSEYGIDSVEADNYGGAQKAVSHLLSLGCRRIAHITAPTNSWAGECRVRGYCDRVEAENMSKIILFGDFSPQSGYDGVKKMLLSSVELPFDGIFAANDQMAIGAIKALRELGVRVPEEVRVVGFDDTFVASLVEPSLSSVHVPAADLGNEAMRMAFTRMNDFSLPAHTRRIETGLVVRRSSDPDVYVSRSFVNW